MSDAMIEEAQIVREMISFDLPTFSFKDESAFPDVQPAASVNLSALVAGDPDPLFITRPLGVLGAVSNNGLVYDNDLLAEIESQIVGKVARQGHVSEETKSWEFPDDVAIWVGAQRVGDTLYGKAYVYPGTHFNTMVRKRKAAGGSLSNSIWGKSSFVETGQGTVRAVGLRVESCDFVPAERAALSALGGKFELTSEMEGSVTEHEDATADLDLFKQTVASISPEDVLGSLSETQRDHVLRTRMSESNAVSVYEMLPAAHRAHVMGECLKETSPEETYKMLSETQCAHIAEIHATTKGMKLVPQEVKVMSEGTVAEMTSQVAEMSQQMAEMKATLATSNQQMAEMQTTIARYEREAFDRALDNTVGSYFADWQVRTEDGKRKLASLQQNLRVLTVAEMAGSTKPEDIKGASDKAWANVKPLAEMTLASLAGPSAMVGVTTGQGAGARYGFDPATNRYTPEAVQAAIQRTNMFGGREGRAK